MYKYEKENNWTDEKGNKLRQEDINMYYVKHRPIKNAETTEKWIFFVSCHKINFNKLINTMIHCHILSTLKAIRYY